MSFLLNRTRVFGFAMVMGLCVSTSSFAGESSTAFVLEEATIADIQKAVDEGALTYEALVRMYLARIAAYEDGGASFQGCIHLMVG